MASRVGRFLAVVIISALIGGCASAASPSPSSPTVTPTTSAASPAPTTAEPITLVQWVAANQVAKPFYETLAADFAKEHANITIKVEEFPFNEEHEKLRLALEAGTGAPDLADIEISRFGLFVKGNIGLLDLTDRLEPYAGDLVTARINAYSYRGRVYGVERCVCPVVLYYRKDVFEAAGISTPVATWEDLIAAGKKIKDQTGKHLFALETLDYDAWTVLMLQFGGNFFDASGTVTMDSPANVRALQFYVDLIRKEGVAAPAPGGDQYNPTYWGAYNQGDFVAQFGADWMGGIIKRNTPDLSGKWAAQPLPTSPDAPIATATVGGTALAITTQSKHPDAAWQWLQFAMLRTESAILMRERLGLLPQYKPSWTAPEITAPDDFFGGQSIGQLLIEQAELLDQPDAPYLVQAPDLPSAYDIFTRTALGPALDGSVSPQDALTEAAAELRAQIGG